MKASLMLRLLSVTKLEKKFGVMVPHRQSIKFSTNTKSSLSTDTTWKQNRRKLVQALFGKYKGVRGHSTLYDKHNGIGRIAEMPA